MFDAVKLLVENQILKSKIARLQASESDLKHDIEQYVSISSDMTAENEDLRALLIGARDALEFFKTWGESLNRLVGHNPTAESWKPALDALAKIDAELK